MNDHTYKSQLSPLVRQIAHICALTGTPFIIAIELNNSLRLSSKVDGAHEYMKTASDLLEKGKNSEIERDREMLAASTVLAVRGMKILTNANGGA